MYVQGFSEHTISPSSLDQSSIHGKWPARVLVYIHSLWGWKKDTFLISFACGGPCLVSNCRCMDLQARWAANLSRQPVGPCAYEMKGETNRIRGTQQPSWTPSISVLEVMPCSSAGCFLVRESGSEEWARRTIANAISSASSRIVSMISWQWAVLGWMARGAMTKSPMHSEALLSARREAYFEWKHVNFQALHSISR